MALNFLKHHNADLEKKFDAKPAKPPRDPMPAKRKKLIEGIDKALAQLKAGELAPKRGWYQGKEGQEGVRVSLKHRNKPLTLDGRSHWTVGDATKFYTDARKDVEAANPDIDAAIIAIDEGKGGRAARGNPTAQRAPSDTRAHTTRLRWYRTDVEKLGKAEADKKLDEKVAAGKMTKADADKVRAEAK